jgi:CheY-like chemotaxis protein
MSACHVYEPLILLVEDNPDDVLLVQIAFEKAGRPYRIHAASHGWGSDRLPARRPALGPTA